ncbi:MAG: DUF3990 domain-containing protein [Prevotella sp.]|nr:DUF3990 domain-containing protein [Prevotella sp.]
MRLYHGSIYIVKQPAINGSNRLFDYGSGFYTTTSYEQAVMWVKSRMNDNHVSTGYINTYEFDYEAAKRMKMLSFAEPTDEWLDFVQNNRTQADYHHDYDIVYGPVANDRVYTQFALYESGVISKDILIEELKTYKLIDQYLFHTESSLTALKFIEAKKVTL